MSTPEPGEEQIPVKNECGGYYCDEDIGHIDCDYAKKERESVIEPDEEMTFMKGVGIILAVIGTVCAVAAFVPAVLWIMIKVGQLIGVIK